MRARASEFLSRGATAGVREAYAFSRRALALALSAFFSVAALCAQALPPLPSGGAGAAQDEGIFSEGEGVFSDDEGGNPSAKRNFLSAGGDVLFFIEDGSLESDSMPVLPAAFASFGFAVADFAGIEVSVLPSLGFYTTHYRWSASRARPAPAAVENREASVLGFALGAAAEFRYALRPSFTLRGTLGLVADLRAVAMAGGLNAGVDDIDAIAARNAQVLDWFWSRARWLYGRASLGFEWRGWENYGVGLEVGAWAPFDGPQALAGDPRALGWRFGVGVRFTRFL